MPISYPAQKSIKDLDARPETETLREKHIETPEDVGTVTDLLSKSPVTQEIRARIDK
jgi:hypothetical protein